MKACSLTGALCKVDSATLWDCKWKGVVLAGCWSSSTVAVGGEVETGHSLNGGRSEKLNISTSPWAAEGKRAQL